MERSSGRRPIAKLIFTAMLFLGLPLALAAPGTLGGKMLAVFALLILASAVGLVVAVNSRRVNDAVAEAELAMLAGAMPGAIAAQRRASLAGIDTTQWSLELLGRLDAQSFGALCAAYYETLGFEQGTALLAAAGDLRLSVQGAGIPTLLLRCRAGNAAPLGADAVREFAAVLALSKVPQGMLAAAGEFSQEAKDFASTQPVLLVSGAELLAKLLALPADPRRELLDRAVNGP